MRFNRLKTDFVEIKLLFPAAYVLKTIAGKFLPLSKKLRKTSDYAKINQKATKSLLFFDKTAGVEKC